MNEPESLGLLLGNIVQYTDRGAKVEASESIKIGEGRTKLEKVIPVTIRNDQGYLFGVGAYIPRWLDERLRGGKQMPSWEELLVMDTWKAETSSPRQINLALKWGYYNQFKEVVNQMANLPLYRLLVRYKGEFVPKLPHRDLDYIRSQIEEAYNEIFPQGHPDSFHSSKVFRLQMANGKTWRSVEIGKMKSLLFE